MNVLGHVDIRLQILGPITRFINPTGQNSCATKNAACKSHFRYQSANKDTRSEIKLVYLFENSNANMFRTGGSQPK